jgi:hypothetical protein
MTNKTNNLKDKHTLMENCMKLSTPGYSTIRSRTEKPQKIPEASP